MTIRSFSLTVTLAQVTGLSAVAVSSTQINLSWSAVTGATSYRLYRNGSLFGSVMNGTTASDTGLAPSTQYTYAVSAVANGIEGPLSASASATTQSGQQPVGNPLYVSTTGDDSRTKAQARNPATPWRTIHRAVKGSATAGQTNASEAAAAGDTVLVSPGVYNEVGTTGDRWNVILNPVNNGTAGSPITIKGNGGRPEIRAASATVRGPMIGASGKTYVVWDSFRVDDYYCGSVSDTGPVVLHNGSNYQILNCEIFGHSGSYFWGHTPYTNNYPAVRGEVVTNCTIRNNKISRVLSPSGGQGGQNDCGMQFYDFANGLVERNTIWNVGSGIFMKGKREEESQSDNVIRLNLISDARYGIWLWDGKRQRCYQNVVYSCDIPNGDAMGLRLQSDNQWLGIEGSYVVNNTLYANSWNIGNNVTTASGIPTGLNVTVLGNISASATFGSAGGWVTSDPTQQGTSYNRNLHHNNPYTWRPQSGGPLLSFAQWQASPYNMDSNGVSADPLFVNAAALNFRLQTGSSAASLSRDVLGIAGGDANTVIPAGAYITGAEQIGADW